MDHKPLKAFISYKWEDDAHNSWVKKFASDLRAAGVDAILDRWEVRLGDSFTDYMTSRIAEADVILFVMTSRSVAAAEAQGQGGAVKFEMQMATSRRIAGEKMRLIGIYREGDKTVAHLRDHRYADFRDDAQYRARLQELLDDLLEADGPPPLGINLSLSEAEDRLRAVQTLGALGPSALSAAPMLVKLFSDPVYAVRIGAMKAVAAMGEGAIPLLIEALGDQGDVVRALASKALSTIGPKAKDAVPVLSQLLVQERSKDLRAQVAYTLAHIAPEIDGAIPALIHALSKDSNEVTRRNACLALERLGAKAKDAIPAIIERLLTDGDATVRSLAADALPFIAEKNKEVESALKKALKDDSSQVRSAAEKALRGEKRIVLRIPE